MTAIRASAGMERYEAEQEIRAGLCEQFLPGIRVSVGLVFESITDDDRRQKALAEWIVEEMCDAEMLRLENRALLGDELDDFGDDE